jgi:methionyl-tRNA formyltransferase
MKILILCNKDIASNFALNLLIPKLKDDHQLHLWLSAKVGESHHKPQQLRQLKFFEQDLLNQLLSPLLINSQPPKFKRFEGFEPYLFSRIREENTINSSESTERLQRLAPDLIISIRYGCILKDKCIKIPKHGVINLHSGILPKYRGVMATFWAMQNGDETIGTTLHKINDGTIDTGEIIKISTLVIQRDKSYLQHTLELYRQGTKDIIDATLRFSRNEKIVTYPQPKSDSYFTFPKLDDLVKFEKKGLKLIDEQAYIDFICQHYLPN